MTSSKDERGRRKQLKDAYLRTQHAASAARMPLERTQLEALLVHVDDAVEANGCDHSWAVTDDWAAGEGVDLKALHEGLEEYGGFCDCEVVMNLDAEEIFTPVRTPRG